MTKPAVNYEAWAKNAVAFIRERGLDAEFTDWSGGWRAPFEGHRADQSPPEGFVLAPREITLAMQHAYFAVIDKNLARVETDARFGRYASQQEAYRAMIAAAERGA